MRTSAIVLALLFALGSTVDVAVANGLSGFVVADSQCCTQTNGGGNVPSGTAVGVDNTNKGGNAPPGQQPSPAGQDKK